MKTRHSCVCVSCTKERNSSEEKVHAVQTLPLAREGGLNLYNVEGHPVPMCGATGVHVCEWWVEELVLVWEGRKVADS